ncbi:sugar transferase, partial [bacterium]
MKALFLKRPFDILLSSLGILLSSPLWLFVAVLIRLEDQGPVFYKQDRVG